ncbi:MAG: VCBS repeat-containing protein [Planctomycetes bacterium]|nr:VCBS repeat-containing protein [Planctomycetota bacterium]
MRSLFPRLTSVASCAVVLTSALSAQYREVPLKQHLPRNPSGSAFGTVVDLDQDGDLELLSSQLGGIRILENDGHGEFTDVGRLADDSRGPVTCGDFDGDGDLDLFASRPGGFAYYRNDGSAFVDVTNGLFQGPRAAAAVVVGDVDADGDLDAVVLDSDVRMFVNDGIGRFTEVTSSLSTTPIGSSAVMALRDVDADTDLDLIIVQSDSLSVLMLNDGSGAFTAATGHLPFEAGWRVPFSVLTADVDGDGDDDLVAGWGQTPETTVWQNDGTGRFTDITASSVFPGHGDREVRSGDLDGDGDVDLVVGPCNRILLNNGVGQFADATAGHLASGDDSTWVAVGDVDGDGDPDLCLGRAGTQDMLFLNDGTAHFTAGVRTRFPSVRSRCDRVAVGDVNGDGVPDVLAADSGFGGGQSLHVLVNDGDARFSDQTVARVPVMTDPVLAFELVDLLGDGVLHAFAVGPIGPVRYLRNDGLGRFTDRSWAIPGTAGPATSIASGDVNGDGLVDLLIGSALVAGQTPVLGGQNALYQAVTGTSFADVTGFALPAVSDLTLAVELADVDGDSDLDALIANDGLNALWRNDGRGVFTDATAGNLPPFSARTAAIALADFDGDGDLDLFTANRYRGVILELLINDGTGMFSDASANLPVMSTGMPTSAEAVDFDGDGDPDILLGLELSGSSRTIELLRNDGTGRFTNATGIWFANSSPSESVFGFAFADVDADGDSDLVTSGYPSPRVLLNVDRPHLLAPIVPRLGAPYRIRIETGAALSFAGYWLSFRDPIAPAPSPFGDFRLDPFGLISLGLRPLGSNFTIPANPGLAGLVMHWQAAWAPPTPGVLPRFSDIVTDRILP